MQIASILSDLTSLRVCDQTAALALVSVHKTVPLSFVIPTGASIKSTYDSSAQKNRENNVVEEEEEEEDIDMGRATDLMELHQGFKMKHMPRDGVDEGLRQARRDVQGVLEKLTGRAGIGGGLR